MYENTLTFRMCSIYRRLGFPLHPVRQEQM
jgi:hypothetical protein